MIEAIIISFANGWACSNEGKLDFDFLPLETGVLKKQLMLKIDKVFSVEGEVKVGDTVECVARFENKGVTGYRGVLSGKTREVMSIEIKDVHIEHKNIINNIKRRRKSWQGYYRVN